MKKFLFLILSLINTAVTAIYIYLSPVETVPSHYGPNGQADAFSTKWMLMIFPCILIAFGVFYTIFCLVLKNKQSYIKNEKYVFRTVGAAFIFLLAEFWALFLASINWVLDLGSVLPVFFSIMLGALIVFISNMFGKIKQNSFLGIRTKATLSSENVWKKTHRLGGYIGAVGGLLMIILGIIEIFMNEIATVLFFGGFIVLVLIICGVPIIYAHILYSKEKKQGAI